MKQPTYGQKRCPVLIAFLMHMNAAMEKENRALDRSSFFQSLFPASSDTRFSVPLFTSFFSLLLFVAFTFYLFKFRSPAFTGKAEGRPLPPGPKPWPVVGNLPEMVKNKPAFRWIHCLMHDMKTDIACFRFWNVHVIPVTCPEMSRAFLKTQDAIFASRPLSMSTYVTSRGYLSTALSPFGEQWKKMRGVVARHMVSPANHRWLHGKRVEESNNLVHYVYNQCKNSRKVDLVKVRSIARHYCSNVIRKMIFNKRYFGEGMEAGGPGFEEEDHVDALFGIHAYLFSFRVSDYVPCSRGLDLDGHEKVVKELNEILGKYHDPIIEKRIRQWWKGAKKKQEDLLDVLITMKDADGSPLLSTEEIKAEITDLMLATVDNPSNALEWAMAEMINQPEMLQKAPEELDRVVGKERLVQESDLSELNYIKACAREAFRLHPIARFNVLMCQCPTSQWAITSSPRAAKSC